MNKKYIKIGFAAFFVIFVTFIIIRKLSIDEKSSENKIASNRVIEKKQPVDPRINIKLKDTSSKTDIHIKEDISKNKILTKIEESNEKIKSDINNIKDKTPSSPITHKKVLATSSETPVEKDKNLKAPISKEIQKAKNIKKKIDILDKKIAIYSISDLKKAKKAIKIDSNTYFLYKEKQFKVGDSFGAFTVVDIKPRKIRFKESENFFYNLRFFI